MGQLSQREHPTALWIAAKPYAEEPSGPAATVLVLEPSIHTSQTSEYAQAIKLALSRKSIACEAITWPPTDLDMVGRSIISLLELENPFLDDLSPMDFELLKATILRSSSFLWITQGKRPSTGAAMGYLRALKNENPNLNLRYLRLEDSLDRNILDVAQTLTKVGLDPNIDREFVEVDRQICINRWTPDGGMSRIISSDSANIESLALEKCQNPLELVAGPDYHFKDSGLSSDLLLDIYRLKQEPFLLGKSCASFVENPSC